MRNYIISLNPIFDEIKRYIILTQNEDGSWGNAKRNELRIFLTVLAIAGLKSLSDNKCKETVKDAKIFLNQFLNKKPQNITNETAISGLFLYYYLSDLLNVRKEKLNNIRSLINYWEKKEYLKLNMVSAYVLYFDSKNKTARRVLKTNGVFDEEKGNYDLNRNYILPLLKSFDEGWIKKTLEEKDIEKIGYVLLGLTKHKRENALEDFPFEDIIINEVRRKYLDSLNRKISRGFLNLTALLKEGHEDVNLMNNKIRADSGELIKVKKLNGNKCSIEIDLHKIQKLPMEGNIIPYGMILFSLARLSHLKAAIMDISDFYRIKDELEYKNTFRIGKKRIFIYESIVLLAILYIFYLISPLVLIAINWIKNNLLVGLGVPILIILGDIIAKALSDKEYVISFFKYIIKKAVPNLYSLISSR